MSHSMPFYIVAIKAQIKYPAICFPGDTLQIERDRWVKAKDWKEKQATGIKGSSSGLLSFRMQTLDRHIATKDSVG